MSSRLPVDADRLWDDIMALAAISDPERPYTRRSFTPLYQQGRAWLERRFKQAGLEVRIDAAGNLTGRRAGADSGLKAIVLGSHSDTVPSGGRFDGIAGVIAALETARSLKDAGVVLRHQLEVVDFLAEEPSEFGLSCVGSRGMAGVLEPSMLALKVPGTSRWPTRFAGSAEIPRDSRRRSGRMSASSSSCISSKASYWNPRESMSAS